MKVLQIGPYPPPYGGVQTNLVAIRSFLRKRGIPCAVINVTRHRKPEADNVYYPETPAQVVQLLARLDCDLIHQHIGGLLTNRILALGLACTLRPGAKAVMTFHSGGFPSMPEGQALGPNSFAGFVFRRFDGLIGVNDEIMGFFAKMRVRDNRARLIPPHAFISEEGSAASIPEPLATFLSEHDPLLLSAGQLEPEYDLALQIDAIAQLRKKFPRAGLAILGSGSLERELRSKIEAQPGSEHILLAGDVPHAATMAAMSRSRIVLRTTLYDGDAISVREALHVGTPVIASDNGMRPPGVHLVPKCDLDALLRAIEEVLAKPAVRSHASNGDESNLQAVLEFYQEILGRSPR